MIEITPVGRLGYPAGGYGAMMASPSTSASTARVGRTANDRSLAAVDESDERREPAVHFDFAFDPAFRIAGLPFGIVPSRTGVEVDDERITARFGPWVVSTPLANVLAAHVTGPYHPVKVVGGPRLSLTDRGITFATNPRSGVCVQFVRPVRGLDPLGRLTHPGLTVTVAEPAALAELLEVASIQHGSIVGPDRPIPVDDVEQAIADDLTSMSAAELRARARDLGLTGVAKLRKAELVELLTVERETGR